MGNTALPFGGLFGLEIYRVRLSILGYSGVLTDYGVRGLGLLGDLASHELRSDLHVYWPSHQEWLHESRTGTSPRLSIGVNTSVLSG